jgi:sporulation protein YlmC with PRC-barrel domain
MNIPLKAPVECSDGVCGKSEYVVLNPVTDQVTYVVVKEDDSPHTEYMIPVDYVAETNGDTIRLQCSKEKLEKMEPFIKTTFIEEKAPDRIFGEGYGPYGMGPFYSLPYVTPDKTVYVPVEDQQVPPGELAVHRGAQVKATDGTVGRVDEFVVNPENNLITHLVMREGHLWGKKEVIIPLSAIEKTEEDSVLLKLDKHQIEALPTFPVHRRWS